MKQGINKDLCSIFQLENCFGASFASKATQIPRRVCASPVFARARVCACECLCVGARENSRFHTPLLAVYLDGYPAYDKHAKQSLNKSFPLLCMQTYLPDQTGDLPRLTLNRGAGCAQMIQEQKSHLLPRPHLHSVNFLPLQASD